MRRRIGIALALAPVAAGQPAMADAVAHPDASVETWTLDQLRIDARTDERLLAALEPVHTLAAAIAVLDRYGVRYQRTRAVLLPSRLPADVRAQIAGLPEGEPFVLPEGGFISISVIVGRPRTPGATSPTPPALLHQGVEP